MDPVSVFNALYDTKCLKFGEYDLKSGLKAPYYMNLRRLPLYPALMDAVVTQVYDYFLSPQALPITMSAIRRRRARRSSSTDSQIVSSISQELAKKKAEARRERRQAAAKKHNRDTQQQQQEPSDSDSQLGDEAEDELEADETSGEELPEDGNDDCRDVVISGVPYGAVPLAAAIAYKAKIPFLFERKESKDYGDQQALVDEIDEQEIASGRGPEHDGDQHQDEHGDKPKQRPVILVEDVICSGESILETAKRLEKQNLKVEFVICIVDREANGINLLLKQAGIRVLSLYKISAILRVLEATGRIRGEQFRSIRQWILENQFKAIGVNPSPRLSAPAAAQPGQLEAGHQVEVAAN
jgi:orotate phosphoribosyltransferase